MAVGDSATPAAAKISIPLAALLQRCAAAVGDCDGLLFGRASRLPAPPPSLSDYDDHAASPALSISVSGHCTLSHPSSLSDPLDRFQPPSAPSASATVGFFSSRRHTPLRPSTREVAVASSLSKSLARTHPLLFLLQPLLLHPLLRLPRLPPHRHPPRPGIPHRRQRRPLHPDQYHSFTAESPLPWLPPAACDGPARDHLFCGGASGGVGWHVRRDAQEAGEACQGGGEEQSRVLEQENRNLVLRFRYAGLQ